MAEQADRTGRFRGAAEVLAEDAVKLASKLRSSLNEADYERAEGLASGLQRAARDVKWLMQRQPKPER
jgi:hypothetical protein